MVRCGHRLEPGGSLDRARHHQGADPGAGGGIVVDVDELDETRGLELLRDLDEPPAGTAERRIELHRDDELPLAKRRCKARLPLLLAERRRDLMRVLVEPDPHGPLRVDRRADRRDLGGSRSATAADHARAEIAGVRRELAEVLGRRMRVDHLAAEQAGETDVREGRERPAGRLHLLERRQGGKQARAMIRAERGDVELGEPLRRLARADSRERLGLLVEGQERHDRKRRDAAHRRDRVDELPEIEERLEHEEVGSAAVEHRGLLREELEALLRGRDLTERADRAPDEHVSARQLPCLPGQLHRRRVDPLQVVLEVMGRELPTVRAERVRLDQLRAGVDEAHVQGDDGLRSAQIRLLRRAQPRHRRGQQRPHPAVRDDRQSLAQTALEPSGHVRKVDKAALFAVK